MLRLWLTFDTGLASSYRYVNTISVSDKFLIACYRYYMYVHMYVYLNSDSTLSRKRK